MTDDKDKLDGRDRATAAGSEPYELDHFAQKHGISREDAEALIKQHGNNRKLLDGAAEGLKLSRGGSFNPNAKI